MNSFIKFCLLLVQLDFFYLSLYSQTSDRHDLYFAHLPTSWDEAIPLGNGLLGTLVWQKDYNLRFSLDRADLWDLRPMKGLHREEFRYAWVTNQVMKNDYKIVQDYFDAPYDREPGPSKIPGAALEFDTKNWGNVISSQLNLKSATCEVIWSNGVKLKSFVHAIDPVGWFRFENVPSDCIPRLIAPKFEGEVKNSGDPVGGDDLSRLGYKQGIIKQDAGSILFIQHGWGGFLYKVSVRWKLDATTMVGIWSISAHYPNDKKSKDANTTTASIFKSPYTIHEKSHQKWWAQFWDKSAIHVPDSTIEKQWYLEQYKFGSASRRGAPPISLQAIWTADNGRIPPWKGDFHHDLNTQLSYWPCYSANHLQEGLSYFDHLEKNKSNYKRYTKLYFNKKGLAVPGVTTLDGTEMGGWIQYSLSPTVSAWLAHHFYLHWRYSMDRDFLKQSAYPWIKETAEFIEDITIHDDSGFRRLPISSSPEIYNNDLKAWFTQNSNYDLALMKFCLNAAAELALELGLEKDAHHWNQILKEFGDLALTSNNELMFTPKQSYDESHRHFSHAVAIHPLGMIKWEDGHKAQSIIKNTLHQMDSIGPAWWCGYSYAWLANLKARAKDGDGALRALDIFAKAFCLPNSFHVNGDQTKSGLSNFTYKPFTLEGNFAFAAALQEMLLQSYAGFIEVMPAVPYHWNDIGFSQLRAEGAFLVDAQKTNGQVDEVKILAEKGGSTKLKLPFKSWVIAMKNKVEIIDSKDGFVTIYCKAGGTIVLKNEYK